ncbi:MAG: GAF domain-containing protein, partial [Mycobacterium sp.]
MTSDDSESTFAELGQRALIGQMHEALDKVLAARDQMEQLLRAIVKIGSDLDLDETLHHVVTAARELTGCRYGALATCDPDGNLTSFVHAGMDADAARRIGSQPVGKGILAVVLGEASALRLDDLTAHPAAAGFPENYPAMRAFLGVPIIVRGSIFGGLYLTDDRPAWT